MPVVLFSIGFQPFYLGAAVLAALAVPAWYAAYSGWLPLGPLCRPRPGTPAKWCSVWPAVVGGFLVTGPASLGAVVDVGFLPVLAAVGTNAGMSQKPFGVLLAAAEHQLTAVVRSVAGDRSFYGDGDAGMDAGPRGRDLRRRRRVPGAVGFPRLVRRASRRRRWACRQAEDAASIVFRAGLLREVGHCLSGGAHR